MSTSYEAFLPDVVQFVRDVPEIVAIHAIRNACIEFCEETRYLQIDNDPVAIVANEADYGLDTDTGYRIIDIVEAWAGDQFLIPKSLEELSRIYRTTDWRTNKGNPYYFYRTRMGSVTLVPIPTISSATSKAYLKCRVAVAPSRNSTSVDDDIYERFVETISHGARARLYGTANQPYHDPKAELIYRKKFNDDIADVRTRVNKGLTRASGQVEFQRWV